MVVRLQYGQENAFHLRIFFELHNVSVEYVCNEIFLLQSILLNSGFNSNHQSNDKAHYQNLFLRIILFCNLFDSILLLSECSILKHYHNLKGSSCAASSTEEKNTTLTEKYVRSGFCDSTGFLVQPKRQKRRFENQIIKIGFKRRRRYSKLGPGEFVFSDCY